MDYYNENAAAAHATKKQNQLETANICREYLTEAVMAKVKELEERREE
jgi:hypothetical protein